MKYNCTEHIYYRNADQSRKSVSHEYDFVHTVLLHEQNRIFQALP
jgi:hypothetical protein